MPTPAERNCLRTGSISTGAALPINRISDKAQTPAGHPIPRRRTGRASSLIPAD
jgi:hypothetical protein